MERDLAALGLAANVAQQRTFFGQGMRTSELLDQFARSLRAELDFRREADAMEEMATLLGERFDVRIPTVHKELCTRRLLVQERFEGFTVGGRRSPGIVPDRPPGGWRRTFSRRCSIRSCASASSTPILIPATCSSSRTGQLGLIDFGAVGRLDSIQQAAVVDILAALVQRDVEPSA